MTETEQKALALVNEGLSPPFDLNELHPHVAFKALCRAIEQHEAFRQEVSDAIVFALKVYCGHSSALDPLRRFIIAKPDPLVEVINEIVWDDPFDAEDAIKLRAHFAKHGLKIVEAV